MIRVNLKEIPQKELNLLNKTYSYLNDVALNVDGSCARSVEYENWPVYPQQDLSYLWVRQLEDAIYDSSMKNDNHDLTRFSIDYGDQLSDVGESLTHNYHQRTDPEILAILHNSEFTETFDTNESDDNEIFTDEDDSDALIKCSRCNGKATWQLRQTRSADEPMTQMCRCLRCGKEWRQ